MEDVYRPVLKKLEKEEERKERIMERIRKEQEGNMGRVYTFSRVRERTEDVLSVLEGLVQVLDGIGIGDLDVYGEDVKYLGKHRKIIGSLIEREDRRELNNFLATKADEVLQEWMRKNKIERGYEVHVRYTGKYLPVFVVKLGKEELIQFSIQEDWYGTREGTRTVDYIKQQHKEVMERLDKVYKKKKKEMEKWELKANEPKKYYKGLKNKITLLMYGEDEIKKVIKEGPLKRSIREYKNIVEEREREKLQYKKQKDKIRMITQAVEDLEDFFKEKGYRREYQRYLMY